MLPFAKRPRPASLRQNMTVDWRLGRIDWRLGMAPRRPCRWNRRERVNAALPGSAGRLSADTNSDVSSAILEVLAAASLLPFQAVVLTDTARTYTQGEMIRAGMDESYILVPETKGCKKSDSKEVRADSSGKRSGTRRTEVRAQRMKIKMDTFRTPFTHKLAKPFLVSLPPALNSS